jgi:peptidoglycan/xylan/chitin deacetylase (PgdA/CDA1 family)
MILMYHKVDIVTPTVWWLTPGDLARHIEGLQHKEFVYLDDYASPESQVVITFDDAYENIYRHALPVLTAHHVPFEVFVIGDQIGRWNHFDPGEPLTRHMDMTQLEEIRRCGGRLQWHTRTHPHLPDLNAADVEKEMTVPEDLADKFPSPHFTWFSYPGGAHDDRAVAIARRQFAGAVSVIDGQPNDRWQLNRVTVDRNTAISPHDVSDLLRNALTQRGRLDW